MRRQVSGAAVRLFAGGLLGLGGWAGVAPAQEPHPEMRTCPGRTLWGWAAVAPAQEPRPSVLPDLWQDMLTRQAQAEVTHPFTIQTANGTVFDQTLWTYNFNYDRPGELHGSGMTLLDRLARRYMDQGKPLPLRLYLQRSQERAVAVKPAVLAVRRAETDQQHFQAITEYLAAFWPDVPYTLVVYDPAPQGISAIDARTAYLGMQATSLGYIPAGFRVEAASSKGGPTSGGIIPVTVPPDVTTSTPSAIGASEGAMTPGPPPE